MSWNMLKEIKRTWRVIKSCNALKVLKNCLMLWKIFNVIKHYWRFSKDLKALEKVPWYVLKCPERFLMRKGFKWWCPKKSLESSWKILKGPKMSWNVRKFTRISERSLNSRRYGMLCVLVSYTQSSGRF